MGLQQVPERRVECGEIRRTDGLADQSPDVLGVCRCHASSETLAVVRQLDENDSTVGFVVLALDEPAVNELRDESVA